MLKLGSDNQTSVEHFCALKKGMSNVLTLFISCLWHAKLQAVIGVAFLDRVGFGGWGGEGTDFCLGVTAS